jgi:hypothetical protein
MASGFFVEPFLRGLDNLLVLPPRNATLPSRRALSLNRTCVARIDPMVKLLAMLLSRKAIFKFLTRRAATNVSIAK